MTALELLRVAEERGVRVERRPGEDRLLIVGPDDARRELLEEFRRQKHAVLALVASGTRSSRKLPASLHVGRWVAAVAPCAFAIGTPGERCRRCNAPFLEHLGLDKGASA